MMTKRTDGRLTSKAGPEGAWWTASAIAAMIVALGAISVAQLADPGNGGGGYMRVALLVSLLVIMMSASRFVKGRWGLAKTSQHHDEFEQQVLARAGARAHVVMMLLLTAIFGWLAVAGLTGSRVPQSASDWATLGLSVVGIGFALPILFAERLSPTAASGTDQDVA